jgi:hypothetical protein
VSDYLPHLFDLVFRGYDQRERVSSNIFAPSPTLE